MSQVFVCLNLNGRFLSILSTKIADDWTRFYPKYKFRSTSCVLVCYSCGVAMVQRVLGLQMFHVPSMVILSIAATRIYRSLSDRLCLQVH